MAVHILPVQLIRRPPDRSVRTGNPAPCPFCGNAQLVKVWADDPDGDGEGADARVQCGACSAEGPVTASVPNAVRAWNMRREVIRG
jgi:Lar family restriction alleviation protein